MHRKIQFANKIVLFTGFRSAELKKYITNNKGKVVESMTNDVNLLIVHGSKGVKSAKVAEARKRKIKVVIFTTIEFYRGEPWIIIELTPQLEKLLTRPKPKTISSTSYFTHDNGARPFRVFVNNSKKQFEVFCPHEMVYKNYIQGLENRWTEHAVKPTKFQKIWIGKDPKVRGAIGNSVLAQLSQTKYMFIGDTIFTFDMKEDVISYKSPIGNSDVAYPYIVGKNNVYFLNSKSYRDRKGINLKEDFSDFYYMEEGKPFKTKLVHKRLI